MPDSPAPTAAPTAALILAAGGASRFGSAKALLEWGGRSLIRHVTDTAAESALDAICVVVGAEAAAIRNELGDAKIRIAENPDWQEGLGGSIAAGVRVLEAIEAERGVVWRGVVVLLCDQPFVTSRVLRELVAAGAGNHSMAACRYAGRLGVPAYFDRSHFDALLGLSGDRGAKTLLEDDTSPVEVVDFPDGEFDIDTRDDYQRALARRNELE